MSKASADRPCVVLGAVGPSPRVSGRRTRPVSSLGRALLGPTARRPHRRLSLLPLRPVEAAWPLSHLPLPPPSPEAHPTSCLSPAHGDPALPAQAGLQGSLSSRQRPALCLLLPGHASAWFFHSQTLMGTRRWMARVGKTGKSRACHHVHH